MNDNSSSAMREFERLRLILAFIRIDDAAQRLSIIELAERLAKGTPATAPAAADGQHANVTPQHMGPTLS